MIQGRVKRIHFTGLLDKIKSRITAWRGRHLSLQGRCVLIKSVLSSIPVYNMSIYKWPSSIIIDCEILWTGDPFKAKKTTVAWDKSCKPSSEGGLGLQRMKELNLALLMKLAWQVLTTYDEFSVFIRHKFFTYDGEQIQYHTCSSICNGIKWALSKMVPYVKWIIGDGRKADLWRSCCACTHAIKNALHLRIEDLKHCRA
ncbi:hypothetical protein IFM89_019008 [Coptis chinensis]|uniref:Uncharacterized protein n=1 Tax=Coptis chinensis TaxID=261450 RepID=A0A835I1F6_9MAGN|nr:hypothetical protein IFM89_019008 [Coptis chinensis]